MAKLSTEARVPLNKTLKAGEEYVFEFTSATLNELVIINEGQITPFEKNGDKLTLKVTARKGKLAVGADGKEGQYAAVLLYMVEIRSLSPGASCPSRSPRQQGKHCVGLSEVEDGCGRT